MVDVAMYMGLHSHWVKCIMPLRFSAPKVKCYCEGYLHFCAYHPNTTRIRYIVYEAVLATAVYVDIVNVDGNACRQTFLENSFYRKYV